MEKHVRDVKIHSPAATLEGNPLFFFFSFFGAEWFRVEGAVLQGRLLSCGSSSHLQRSNSCPFHLAGLFLPDNSPPLPAQSANIGRLLILLNLSQAAKSQDPGRQHPSSITSLGWAALLSPQGLSSGCCQLFIDNAGGFLQVEASLLKFLTFTHQKCRSGCTIQRVSHGGERPWVSRSQYWGGISKGSGIRWISLQAPTSDLSQLVPW